MKSFIIKDGFFKLGDDIETANARMERLITTPIDSMYGFLDQGSRVLEYFHMASNQQNAQAILSEIKMLVNGYEKNIKLISIGAIMSTPDNTATDLLEIQIEYELGGNRNKTVVVSSKNGGEN